ncbi:MAG: hypothetical protein NUV93_00635 [Firmicutes bacterium]|nr:hypothetical protein [Bacillota bacterium]
MRRVFRVEREATGTLLYQPDELHVTERGVALVRPHLFGGSVEALGAGDIESVTATRGPRWWGVCIRSRSGPGRSLVINGLAENDALEIVSAVRRLLGGAAGA